MRIFKRASLLTGFLAASLVAQVSSSSAAPSDDIKIVTTGQHQLQLDTIVQPLGSNLKLSPDPRTQEQALNLSKRGLTDLGDELGVILRGTTSRVAPMQQLEAGVPQSASQHNLDVASGFKRKFSATHDAAPSPESELSDLPTAVSDPSASLVAQDATPALPKRAKRPKVARVWHNSMEAEWGPFLKLGDQAILESDDIVLRRKIWTRLRSRKSRFAAQDEGTKPRRRLPGTAGLTQGDLMELNSNDLGRVEALLTRIQDRVRSAKKRRPKEGSREWLIWKQQLDSDQADCARVAERIAHLRAVQARSKTVWVKSRRPASLLGRTEEELNFFRSGNLHDLSVLRSRLTQLIAAAHRGETSGKTTELWQAQLKDNVAWRHGIKLLEHNLPADIEKQIPKVLAMTADMPVSEAVERIPKLLTQLVENAKNEAANTMAHEPLTSVDGPSNLHGFHRASTSGPQAASPMPGWHGPATGSAALHFIASPQNEASTSFGNIDSFARQLEDELEDASSQETSSY